MSTRQTISPMSVSAVSGLLLAGIWGIQAAAPNLRGNRFFPFLLPALLIGFVLWRSQRGTRLRTGNRSGMVIGLACWFIAGTLSAVFNYQTDQVLLTYAMVMVSGGIVFAALSGVVLEPRDLEVAIIGLAIGATLPLVNGLMAFVAEWGIPDISTAITAWQDLARMDGYGLATFGNRGNTAGFILIVTPILLAVAFDVRRRTALRLFCAVPLTLIALNLIVLQVRAAFVALFFAGLMVWIFKVGAKRLPWAMALFLLGGVVLFRMQPDVGLTMTERLMPVLTVDTRGDDSVQGRADAIEEGWGIAKKNWFLGIGPGAALTLHSRDSAHQFQVQQAMETGFLGLVGVSVLSLGVFISLFRTIARGREDELNDTRFMLLIGPATYVIYAVMANAALNNTTVNTWTVLVASMLALTPAFERRVRRVGARSARMSRLPRLATPQLLRRHRVVPSLAR